MDLIGRRLAQGLDLDGGLLVLQQALAVGVLRRLVAQGVGQVEPHAPGGVVGPPQVFQVAGQALVLAGQGVGGRKR